MCSLLELLLLVSGSDMETFSVPPFSLPLRQEEKVFSMSHSLVTCLFDDDCGKAVSSSELSGAEQSNSFSHSLSW